MATKRGSTMKECLTRISLPVSGIQYVKRSDAKKLEVGLGLVTITSLDPSSLVFLPRHFRAINDRASF